MNKICVFDVAIKNVKSVTTIDIGNEHEIPLMSVGYRVHYCNSIGAIYLKTCRSIASSKIE